jgi:CRP-like cAMP-binding protein
MKTVIFLPEDEIIRQGDTGKKLYFISRGEVEIIIGPDEFEGQSFLEEFKKKQIQLQ